MIHSKIAHPLGFTACFTEIELVKNVNAKHHFTTEILIKPLTSLRFFFAMMVLALHYFDWTNYYSNQLLTRFFAATASCGVSFFFMLSGFILSHAGDETEYSKPTNRVTFWIRRFARVYPLYLITLLISVLSYVKTNSDSYTWLMQLPLCIFGLQSFVPSPRWVYAFNPISWSVSCELFFYLTFPFLFLLIRNKKPGLLGLYIAGTVMISFLFAANWKIVNYANPLMRIADFMLGMLLFDFSLKKSNSLSRFRATFLEIGGILLLILMLGLSYFVPSNLQASILYWPAMLLILWIFSNEKGALSKMLSGRLFVYLGHISYSVYLLQHIIAIYLRAGLTRLGLMPSNMAYIAIHFFLLMLFSTLSYHFLELPTNRFFRRKLGQLFKV